MTCVTRLWCLYDSLWRLQTTTSFFFNFSFISQNSFGLVMIWNIPSIYFCSGGAKFLHASHFLQIQTIHVQCILLLVSNEAQHWPVMKKMIHIKTKKDWNSQEHYSRLERQKICAFITCYDQQRTSDCIINTLL